MIDHLSKLSFTDDFHNEKIGAMSTNHLASHSPTSYVSGSDFEPIDLKSENDDIGHMLEVGEYYF